MEVGIHAAAAGLAVGIIAIAAIFLVFDTSRVNRKFEREYQKIMDEHRARMDRAHREHQERVASVLRELRN